MDTDELRNKLAILDNYTSKLQLTRVKLILRASGYPYGALTKVESVPDLHTFLQCPSSQSKEYNTVCLLKYVLQAVGVKVGEKLGSYSEESLSLCQKELQFGELILTLCAEIREDEFKRLKGFVALKLEINPEKIESLEDLFHRCLSQKVLSESDVSILDVWLAQLKRNDLRSKVSNYSMTCTRHGEQKGIAQNLINLIHAALCRNFTIMTVH